jgi:hypothetical protein
MIGDLAFLAVMWGVLAFMANRLYVLVRYRAINIKGKTYSKAQTPIMYWVQMALIGFMLALIGGVAVIMTLYYTDALA